MNNHGNKISLKIAVTALAFALVAPGFAGTITIVGNGAGNGPIFVTDGLGNIDLGTRVRFGTFTDVTSLNAVISAYKAGTSDYNSSLAALNSNFVDLGTNVANYGATSNPVHLSRFQRVSSCSKTLLP